MDFVLTYIMLFYLILIFYSRAKAMR